MTEQRTSSHLFAILQALFVTFLWSTSFVIIKSGLEEIPPLVFAGLRYFLAFLILLPFAFTKNNKPVVKSLKKNDWKKLFLLGLFFYALTQGAQFIGLSLLPSVTVSLMLNFTPLVAAIIAVYYLNEFSTGLQWLGIIIFLTGIIIYFMPLDFSESYGLGLIVMFLGVVSNAFSAVLGREVNRSGIIKPVIITVISMGFGSLLLLITGIFLQGIPDLSLKAVIYIIWLAALNTALAFTIWNKTLQILTAVESSVINGTMLIQIAVLAWIFLGEDLKTSEIAGMLTASLGITLVQIKINYKKQKII
jgi:drug/metabolite transporter (DMT)-like permease